MILLQAASIAVLALGLGATPKGIAVADLDRTVDPCTDFYAFTSGGWRAAHPIPAGMRRWSRRLAAREAQRHQLTDLLEELAADTQHARGSIEQQLGDHFAACLDEAAIDAAGVTPLAALLAELGRVRDRAGVEQVIRRLHELAVPVPFVVSASSSYHDPALVGVNIAAGGLGLPERDYYLDSAPRFAATRAVYRVHVARVLTLGGMPAEAARQAADDIVALETRLAEASLSPALAADPAATAHQVPFAQLASARFDWVRYFEEAGLPQAAVNVAEPAFLQRVEVELESTPVEVWKAYLTWHLLEAMSPWLSRPFAEEAFAFKGKYLGGATDRKPRKMLCLESTEALLGEALGRKYAERYFPPAAKAKVRAMAHELLGLLREDVSRLPWMAPETRREALAKLASYDVKVGYPDAWNDLAGLVIRRDAFGANVNAARRFGVQAERRRVGQRVSRTLWQLPPSSPDAYIDVQLNLMALPAGFLQPPAFDLGATDAVNYGAIGVGMAHDFLHAIDTLGADFDATGQARNWWTAHDREAFQKASQCVVDQYSAYSIAPGLALDGQRVRGEAIGDATGVRLAYRALQRSMQRQPIPTLDGFTPDQQFFIAWGQYRGAAESPELQREMLATDSHPISKFRVIGPLADAPEFQDAFACKAGSAMVKPPEQRCTVW
jgi:endothelin-converting enzyme/putative endopeptidase